MTVFSFVDVRSIKSRRFDALVRPHTLVLYQFAYRLLQNRPDAEDLVQDVLVKLYPRTNEMAKVRDLRPWLLRVVYHQFVDTLRKRQRTIATVPDHEPVELPDPEPGPEQQFSAAERTGQIRVALGRLSQNQRLLVSLHLIDGYTLEEVAQVLDVPLGTLKSRLHRTRAELKKLLGLEPFPSFERVNGHELP
jgi:RNA polymerase sigma-70 factor (ECF subfamily)